MKSSNCQGKQSQYHSGTPVHSNATMCAKQKATLSKQMILSLYLTSEKKLSHENYFNYLKLLVL